MNDTTEITLGYGSDAFTATTSTDPMRIAEALARPCHLSGATEITTFTGYAIHETIKFEKLRDFLENFDETSVTLITNHVQSKFSSEDNRQIDRAEKNKTITLRYTQEQEKKPTKTATSKSSEGNKKENSKNTTQKKENKSSKLKTTKANEGSKPANAAKNSEKANSTHKRKKKKKNPTVTQATNRESKNLGRKNNATLSNNATTQTSESFSAPPASTFGLFKAYAYVKAKILIHTRFMSNSQKPEKSSAPREAQQKQPNRYSLFNLPQPRKSSREAALKSDAETLDNTFKDRSNGFLSRLPSPSRAFRR